MTDVPHLPPMEITETLPLASSLGSPLSIPAETDDIEEEEMTTTSAEGRQMARDFLNRHETIRIKDLADAAGLQSWEMYELLNGRHGKDLIQSRFDKIWPRVVPVITADDESPLIQGLLHRKPAKSAKRSPPSATASRSTRNSSAISSRQERRAYLNSFLETHSDCNLGSVARAIGMNRSSLFRFSRPEYDTRMSDNMFDNVYARLVPLFNAKPNSILLQKAISHKRCRKVESDEDEEEASESEVEEVEPVKTPKRVRVKTPAKPPVPTPHATRSILDIAKQMLGERKDMKRVTLQDDKVVIEW